MVCLGLKPRAAGWYAQTNPLSYCGPPNLSSLAMNSNCGFKHFFERQFFN